MTIEFLLTSLVVVASPGTGVVYTLAAALARGRRASLIAAIGATLGIIPHIAAALLGLAALLHTSALLFAAVKWLGVAYLLYMAWQALRDRGPLHIEPDAEERSAADLVLTGILINILNPKLSIFFVAFLPQFVPTDAAGALPLMLELSLAFMAMTFAVFAIYGLAAAHVRQGLLSRPRAMTWMRRLFAGSFAALGARLAFTDR